MLQMHVQFISWHTYHKCTSNMPLLYNSAPSGSAVVCSRNKTAYVESLCPWILGLVSACAAGNYTLIMLGLLRANFSLLLSHLNKICYYFVCVCERERERDLGLWGVNRPITWATCSLSQIYCSALSLTIYPGSGTWVGPGLVFVFAHISAW